MRRVLFLDNLRYLMVLLVVILHAAMSYSRFAPWWPVKDSSQSTVFDVILLGLDSFLMPVLYFIAGFFTQASYSRNGMRLFLKKKFKRLGLPILLGVPLIGPTFSFLYHFFRKGAAYQTTFAEYWSAYMKQAVDFDIGVITSMDHFTHCHLWFMSLLLLFYLGFILFGRKITPPEGRNSRAGSKKAILSILLLAGLLSSLASLGSKMIFSTPARPQPWIAFGPLLVFQPERIVLYALFFGMGIVAWKKRWFDPESSPPGPVWVWTLVTLALFFGLLAILGPLMADISIAKLAGFVFLRTFFCVTLLVVLLKTAFFRWNRATTKDIRLAQNSYHIYIVHFLIVLFLQLAAAQWTGSPAWIKFSLVSVLSIGISYGFSHYLLRPYPKATLVTLYAALTCVLLFFPVAGG